MADQLALAPHQPHQKQGLVIEEHTAIMAADGQQVAEANALTTVELSQELTDEHGEHLYRLRDGRCILKNAVTTDPELW